MNKPVNSIRQKTAAKPEKADNSGGFRKSISNSIRLILDGKILEWENFNQWFPLLIFLAILGLGYIGNNHLAERKIRETQKTYLRINELKYEYMLRKSQVTEVTRSSFVSENLASTGIKPSITPPKKIFIKPKNLQP
jgi:hypothetical protein